MTDTPWLTTKQAAEYAQRHPANVAEAAREYERTSGRSGLRGVQRSRFAHWRFHRDDLDRWVLGLAPVKAPRKAVA